MGATTRFLCNLFYIRCCCRRYSQKSAALRKKTEAKDDPTLTRNIGILAHIDAGKTTTTERMLFYSGMIKNMGEVHHGNTVTDFMEQERQRGITIASASVTFPWKNHKINLVDTPGHIDFTMEVEQTLNVLDGAVVVLDGTAGVEAQTLTVWRQADRYRIPRLIYVNKMDRPDAGYFQSIHSIESKLGVPTVVLQIPLIEDKVFKGIIDVITMERFEWDGKAYGAQFKTRELKKEDGKHWEDAMSARLKLTETLADMDDHLAELIIKEEKNMEKVPILRLKDSVRKVTVEQRGVPVLCGSSYKNIGVQLLMDAVIHYMPSPLFNRGSKVLDYFGTNLCARAFKVRHDAFRGPVTFFRIYSGQMTKGQKIYNMRLEKSEQTGKVLIAYADDYEEVDHVSYGNIAAVTGLKQTMTGDLVSSTASAVTTAVKKSMDPKKPCSEEFSQLFPVGAYIPDPVFFCSIEPPSQAHQATLEKALTELEREDPSLRVRQDDETGQTVLAGMGELHLDVIRERIRKEYKVEAELGPLQIAYKETLLQPAKTTMEVSHKIGSSTHSVKVTLSLAPSVEGGGDLLLLDKSQDSAANISAIFPKHLLAVKNGVEAGLLRGPKLNCPVINVKATLHWLEVGRGTSDTIIASVLTQCVRKLLEEGGTRLLEPVMQLEVVCADDFMSSVMSDVTRKRAVIQHVATRGHDKVLLAIVPLAELLGYSTILRTKTSGTASFSMEFLSLREMSSVDEAAAIKSVTGFDP